MIARGFCMSAAIFLSVRARRAARLSGPMMNDVPGTRASLDEASLPGGGLRAVIRQLPLTGRLLIICRAARSIGQGALVVDFAFYLAALHWTTVQMGALYMGGLLLGALLTMASGPLSDRVGRKPFLLAYGIVQGAAAIAAMLTSAPAWLIPAAIVGAFGRGANGAAGPFGPVEQAWLADGIKAEDFGQTYSVNAAVGFGGMAVGSLLAMLPAWWAPWLPGPLSYRPLFLLVLLGAIATLVLLHWMEDSPSSLQAQRRAQEASTHSEWRHERGMLARLVGINALNGLAMGTIGPFMAFWFHLRFGERAAMIGPVLAGGFIVAIFSSLWTGWVTRRLGTCVDINCCPHARARGTRRKRGCHF
jgi:MFS family permease